MTKLYFETMYKQLALQFPDPDSETAAFATSLISVAGLPFATFVKDIRMSGVFIFAGSEGRESFFWSTQQSCSIEDGSTLASTLHGAIKSRSHQLYRLLMLLFSFF